MQRIKLPPLTVPSGASTSPACTHQDGLKAEVRSAQVCICERGTRTDPQRPHSVDSFAFALRTWSGLALCWPEIQSMKRAVPLKYENFPQTSSTLLGVVWSSRTSIDATLQRGHDQPARQPPRELCECMRRVAVSSRRRPALNSPQARRRPARGAGRRLRSCGRLRACGCGRSPAGR